MEINISFSLIIYIFIFFIYTYTFFSHPLAIEKAGSRHFNTACTPFGQVNKIPPSRMYKENPEQLVLNVYIYRNLHGTKVNLMTLTWPKISNAKDI